MDDLNDIGGMKLAEHEELTTQAEKIVKRRNRPDLAKFGEKMDEEVD